MKVAIMQPYFFPYIGYFQLINAVDKFIIYDDVNYINRGWINRNNILVNGAAHLIQVPLVGASQNKLINEIEIVPDTKWKTKLLKTIHQSYVKAPFFNPVYTLVESVLNEETRSISALNLAAIKAVCGYIGIQTEIIPSSSTYTNKHLKGQERILDICKQENVTHYINPIGGITLYDKNYFSDKNIDLFFIQTKAILYKQQQISTFIPHLSILDVLMNVGKIEINELLNNYELI
jgi:hypothetical protein